MLQLFRDSSAGTRGKRGPEARLISGNTQQLLCCVVVGRPRREKAQNRWRRLASKMGVQGHRDAPYIRQRPALCPAVSWVGRPRRGKAQNRWRRTHLPVLYSTITAARGVLLFSMFLLDAPLCVVSLQDCFIMYLVLAPVHGQEYLNRQL